MSVRGRPRWWHSGNGSARKIWRQFWRHQVSKAEAEEKDDPDDGNDPPNSETLVLDAICCPAAIAYPQDIDLLNQAREKAEKTVDELCEMTGQKKPRMYRAEITVRMLEGK